MPQHPIPGLSVSCYQLAIELRQAYLQLLILIVTCFNLVG
jgi:hypothetical protein